MHFSNSSCVFNHSLFNHSLVFHVGSGMSSYKRESKHKKPKNRKKVVSKPPAPETHQKKAKKPKQEPADVKSRQQYTSLRKQHGFDLMAAPEDPYVKCAWEGNWWGGRRLLDASDLEDRAERELQGCYY